MAVISASIVVATPALAQSPKIDITTPHQAKAHAKMQMGSWGWKTSSQWKCLHQLWTNESNWRPTAQNKTAVTQTRDGKTVKLYAGGIPQILGLSPSSSVPTQIQRGLQYISHRYGSPCAAMDWWNRHKWY